MQHAVVLFILTLVGIVLALPMTGNTVAVALQRDNPVLTSTNPTHGFEMSNITKRGDPSPTSTFLTITSTGIAAINNAETITTTSTRPHSSFATVLDQNKVVIIVAGLLVGIAIVGVGVLIHSQLGLRRAAAAGGEREQPSISLQEVVTIPVSTTVGREPAADTVLNGLRL